MARTTTLLEQTFSIFVATDELYTSPLIQHYASLFDVSLAMNTCRLLSFIVPFRGTETDLRKTIIHYNADLVDMHHASIYPNHNQPSATLTLSIEPRDIGVTSIVVSRNAEAVHKPTTGIYTPHFIRNKPVA